MILEVILLNYKRKIITHAREKEKRRKSHPGNQHRGGLKEGRRSAVSRLTPNSELASTRQD